MLVEECMVRRVHCVRPLDTIQHARELMEGTRVNQLPVIIEESLVGIVTDRDLRDAYPSVFEAARRSSQRSVPDDPRQISVETIMTPHVLTVGPSDTMLDAARRMRSERIGALPVVDGGKVVGIITRSDILDAFVTMAASEQPAIAAQPATPGGGQQRKSRKQ